MTARRCLGGAALLLAFAVAGLPPCSGFWPKVMLVKARARRTAAGWLAAAILAERPADHDRLRPRLPARLLANRAMRADAAVGRSRAPARLRRAAALLLRLAGDRPLSRTVHIGGQERGGRTARRRRAMSTRSSRERRHEELARHRPPDAWPGWRSPAPSRFANALLGLALERAWRRPSRASSAGISEIPPPSVADRRAGRAVRPMKLAAFRLTRGKAGAVAAHAT